MSKQKTPAATTAAGRTFKLARPIAVGETVISEVTLTEPEHRHTIAVARQKTATETARTVALLAQLSGLPEDAIRRLKTRDALVINQWMQSLAQAAVARDVVAEAARPADEPLPLANALAIHAVAAHVDDERLVDAIVRANAVVGSHSVADLDKCPAFEPELADRTFVLSVPIPVEGGTPIASVALREPDLDCGIKVESASQADAAQATAVMIAALSGLDVPIVNRMKSRDVARIERWLGFFFNAGSA